MEEKKEEKKKKTDWGLISILLTIYAVVFIFIKWGSATGFGKPFIGSLAALIVGIIALSKKDGGNRTLAIIAIIVAVPVFFISLIWWINFTKLIA